MKKIKKILFTLGAVTLLSSCGYSSNFDSSKKINLYTRDTTSGTRDGFFSKINIGSAKSSSFKDLNNTGDNRIKSSVLQVSSNADMLSKIQNDIYGLGYASLGSVLENKTGKIKALKYEGIEASEENVLNETYKLTRNFNYIIRDDYDNDSKKGKIVNAFISFIFSKDGQRIMKENDGILNVTGESWSKLSEEYKDVLNDETLSFEIKVGGSTSVQKMSQILTSSFISYVKSPNIKFTHNHGGSGDAYKYTQGSDKDGVNALDIAFLSRELSSNENALSNTYGKICVDAIVPICNSVNPYNETALKELVSMYSKDGKDDSNNYYGSYSKWSDLIK